MNKIKGLRSKVFSWEMFLIVILLVEILVFGQLNPRFLRLNVLMGSINDFISICIISLFVTFVMVTGGIDIQAGSIVGLTSITIGLLWQDKGFNVWAAVLVSILVGTLCGLLSGFFVAYTGVQPMVVTLGGSFLYSGLALAVVNMSSSEAYEGISGFPDTFMKLSSGNIAGMPNQLVIFIALVVIAYILLHKTKYGRYIFLCGVNSSACRYSGIRVRPIIMSTYGLSGMSAALAGVVLTSYLGSAKSDLGSSLTLPIITAVVLGGTSNLGGKGGVVGTALAACVIGILKFGLNMSGMASQYLDIPVGILLIIVLAFRMTGSGNKKLLARLKKNRSR
ncbi:MULTISPECIES: ABC transporter permease [Extibacter]|uniref:ABC transporter permease n=1 Tax=Extibacter TaxID=1918452 RepID=UPI001AA1132C|nr:MULTISPECIES: autoinducer 2 import system permease LsrD [Extibacter]BDF33713.1 sugar ABC transporter permease [Lachnospiraceae bacterium]MBO1722420.1 autoinducer 2 import system permease LsrD [Extibacter sp. GGCC_0201]MCB6203474.1 autoinducer 2 import system permease LsrD [Extibacter muris]MCQ4665362.1 autoinducer 2 import system permease LsrD [Extibacter muris]MCQ4694942.1 autoinducer 2 import system permease LsrD [Extibacter muris]